MRGYVLNVPVLENIKPDPVLSHFPAFSQPEPKRGRNYGRNCLGPRAIPMQKTSRSLHVAERFLLIFADNRHFNGLCLTFVCSSPTNRVSHREASQ